MAIPAKKRKLKNGYVYPNPSHTSSPNGSRRGGGRAGSDVVGPRLVASSGGGAAEAAVAAMPPAMVLSPSFSARTPAARVMGSPGRSGTTVTLTATAPVEASGRPASPAWAVAAVVGAASATSEATATPAVVSASDAGEEQQPGASSSVVAQVVASAAKPGMGRGQGVVGVTPPNRATVAVASTSSSAPGDSIPSVVTTAATTLAPQTQTRNLLSGRGSATVTWAGASSTTSSFDREDSPSDETSAAVRELPGISLERSAGDSSTWRSSVIPGVGVTTSGMTTSTANGSAVAVADHATPAVMGSITTYGARTDSTAVRGTDGSIAGAVEAPDGTPSYSSKPNDVQALGIQGPGPASSPSSRGRYQLRQSSQQQQLKESSSPGDKEYRATRTWSAEELQLLWELKTKDPELPPNRVAKIMSKATGIRKTGVQCRTRWTKVDDPSIRKGPWTAEEDRMLANAVIEKTSGNCPPPWVEISDGCFKGKRTSKQCRARFMNHLDPYLRHEPWSVVENAALKAATDFYKGQQIKWASIVKDVPVLMGRSPDAARNQHKILERSSALFKSHSKAATNKPQKLEPAGLQLPETILTPLQQRQRRLDMEFMQQQQQQQEQQQRHRPHQGHQAGVEFST